jgi:hypothetical protein
MEITGKLLNVLPEETGEGRNGPWRKQNFILETQEQYPKKVCITVWGDKINLGSFKDNEVITASINIESREYSGRWFTDVKAWRVVKQQATSVDESPPDYGTVPPTKEIPPEVEDPDLNDLPF